MVVALLILAPIGVFAGAYVSAEVPRPSDLTTNQIARIYAADDTTEITRVVPPEGNRVEVGIDEVPEHVRNAVLSAEDRDFYSNPGFSISGFVRAARDNVMGKDSAGGGSTITQQYVKNVLVGADRTLTRKMKELVISSKMAREWSKDEILEAYLNTIYFGRGAYGIAAASQAYFGKQVGDLSVSEARCSPVSSRRRRRSIPNSIAPRSRRAGTTSSTAWSRWACSAPVTAWKRPSRRPSRRISWREPTRHPARRTDPVSGAA